ncbi:tyrosine-protein phosphatase, partial [Salmonella enterica subsp. enterica]|nr:tyrosine-protein phosphatase [Salmonella enterica subsp. enterica]
TSSGATTRWRSLLRADALHKLTESDINALLVLGVRTVIDLRSAEELSKQPSIFGSRSEVCYHHIPLFDGLAPPHVMLAEKGQMDLSERYARAIESCRPAFVKVATTIAEADDGIVLFNCTAGKDRTGMVAAMLLAIGGVSPDDIAADYALTGKLAVPLLQRLRESALRLGLEEQMVTRLLSAERSAMETLLRHVEARHGGFRNYLGREAGQREIVARLEGRIVGRSTCLAPAFDG